MSARRILWVGTYSEPILFGTGQVLQGRGRGIHAFALDEATGALEPLEVTPGVRNPSYLCLDPTRRFLYCVNEFKELEGRASGAVSAFRIEPASGRLSFLNQKASHGADPCHLTVDRSGRNLLVANFASGSVVVLPIAADGALEEASCVIRHAGSSVDPRRQAGPHAHAVELDAAGRFAFVPELGLDKVMVYAFDPARGRLEPNPAQPWVAVRPGAGPRQLVMHPGGRFAYLINELDCTVTAYAFDPRDGRLAELQTLSTLPAGFAGASSCAELQLTPDGRFLYGSNRGHDSLAGFVVDPDRGTLTPLGHTATGGRIPRHFAIAPSGRLLIAANQDSDRLVVFRLDPTTGALEPTGHGAQVGTPVCVRFLG